MGTRSLTVFKDGDKTEIAVLYRQFDGYPEGHGEELKRFLKGKKECNGIGGDKTTDNAFNGMSCLTASIIAHFKKDIGSFYLYPASTRDCGEEYIYTVQSQGIGKSPKVTIKEV